MAIASESGPEGTSAEVPVNIGARLTLAVAALAMAEAVGLGAFGAHALRARVSPEMLQTWHTAVDYQAWHALGLFGTGLLMLHMPAGRALGVAAGLFVAGIVLFSGSLYVLVLTEVRGWGAVTPFGGVSLIAAWLVLAWGAWAGLGRKHRGSA